MENEQKETLSTYKDIAPAAAVLALDGSRFMELGRPVLSNDITWIYPEDAPGMLVCRRTAVLMLLKAMYSILGKRLKNVRVEFDMGGAVFVRAEGDFELDASLLSCIAEKMEQYRKGKFEITRKAMERNAAIRQFHKNGMDSKARLFQFRLSGTVHVYSLGQFDDYFYGHMAPDAGRIPDFSLIPYGDGFFLHVGKEKFDPSSFGLLFETMDASEKLAAKMGCQDVADLNNIICKGQFQELVSVCEALQEKEIAETAQKIAQSKKRLVLIAGPSSSSKTTFARRLCIQLKALGLHPIPVSADDFFVNREDSPRNPDGSFNFEDLECLDLPLLNNSLKELLEGKEVQLPVYNFAKGEREYTGKKTKMEPDSILVLEGIHCLNKKMSDALPETEKFHIYISALTQLSIDEHNPIPAADGRLLRRIVRDARCRNMSAAATIAMWPTVLKGEEKNIYPYRNRADVVINSASVYELAVLKQFAEPLLFQILPGQPGYEEARRLLKFLDYFLGVSSEGIPSNALLREFTG